MCVMDVHLGSICLMSQAFCPQQDLPHREKPPGSQTQGITEHAMWKGGHTLEMRRVRLPGRKPKHSCQANPALPSWAAGESKDSNIISRWLLGQWYQVESKEGWLDPVQACTSARDWGYQRPTVPFSLGKCTHGLSLTHQSALDQTCLYSLELELLLQVTERIGSPGGSGVW